MCAPMKLDRKICQQAASQARVIGQGRLRPALACLLAAPLHSDERRTKDGSQLRTTTHTRTQKCLAVPTSSSTTTCYTINLINSIYVNIYSNQYMVRCASPVSHDTCKYVLSASSFGLAPAEPASLLPAS